MALTAKQCSADTCRQDSDSPPFYSASPMREWIQAQFQAADGTKDLS